MDLALIEDMVSSVGYWINQVYQSPAVFVLKILIGIYLLILLADIILLLILRDVPGHFRTGVKGMDIPLASKRNIAKRWRKIKERLSLQSVSQYKVAIIEADTLIDEILSGIGYGGENMTERFEQIGEAHLDNHYESLQSAHAIRNRIVHEADFVLDQKAAESVLLIYEDFLRYLEYLD